MVIPIELPVSVDAVVVLASSQHGPEGHFDLPTTGVSDLAPHDHLRTPALALAWLRRRREFTCPSTPPREQDLRVLREIRSAMQDLVRGDVGRFRARRRRLMAAAMFRLDDHRLAPTGAGWGGFAASLLPALLAIDAERARLRRCRNPLCGWLFVDRSGAQRRRWCDMSACGNRMKARRFRLRRRGKRIQSAQ